MTRSIVKIQPSGRQITWGCYQGDDSRITMDIDLGEIDFFKIDYTNWLDSGETITSYTASTAPAVTGSSRSGAIITLNISGTGSRSETTVDIVTSASRSATVKLAIDTRSPVRPDAYDDD